MGPGEIFVGCQDPYAIRNERPLTWVVAMRNYPPQIAKMLAKTMHVSIAALVHLRAFLVVILSSP